MPVVVREAPHPAGLPADAPNVTAVASRAGHDFSRVRVRLESGGPGGGGRGLQAPAPGPREDRSKLSESGPGSEEEEVSKAGHDPQAVRAELGAGRPLDGGVRSRMESAFGHDFSRVRVRADGHAAALAAGLHARAFTVGSDIAFGAGQYHPGTPAGDRLLAHELAHVVQQEGAASAHAPQRKGDGEYNALEADADRAAARVMMSLGDGGGAREDSVSPAELPQLSSGLSLQRQPPDAGTPAPAPAPKCKLKSGPSYSPSGTIKATKSGATKTASFDLSAEFENDAAAGASAACCEVRQYILWTAGGPPNNAGFQPATDFKANTWYEDRDTANKRYGHRTGTHAECVTINHYEDTAGKMDCAKGSVYKGHDAPVGAAARTGQWRFQLKAIDTCDGGKEVGTAASVAVDWDV
ncbi:MAG TPA: DUF4157 domain-containing protein [Pyrinomonadaceae bacterium]|nr:DUF4157 domain-containing protein [Pyrinomonadaceae bacterium]